MADTPLYKVIISARARSTLTTQIRFIALKSPEAARNTRNKLVAAIQSLQYMPERHPFLLSDVFPANKYRRMFVEKWYLIIYQIRNNTVHVELILDCRQDFGWLVP